MVMICKPSTHEGYKLLHDGVRALSRIESNGLKIDQKHLSTAIRYAESEIRRLKAVAKKDDVWLAWRRRFGKRTNFKSCTQLGTVLFEVLGHKAKEFTKHGRPVTSESALEKLDIPFVKDYFALKKMEKAHGTYLKGLRRHTVDGTIHPIFNLHIARTFRSSSEQPNFQNMPIRNEIMGELIRRAFVSRFGYKGLIGEHDFKGVEVSVAACYHKDPNMLSYIKDKSKDMHRDMAMQIYLLKQDQISKKIRHASKNKFVFPEFYGDWWKSCAEALWEAIVIDKLVTADGTPLKDHLRSKGIAELGRVDDKNNPLPPSKGRKTFYQHLKDVENDFWNNRFKVYGKWKKDWFNSYLESGFMATHTGFVISGVVGRKEAINYPVQGSAFHCLLWSLIRIQKKLEKYKMKTVIGGQIHDSLVSDIYKPELRDYMDICHEVLTQDILKYHKWLIVPLEAEVELAPPGYSWFSKTPVVYEDRKFSFTPKGQDKPTRFGSVDDFLDALAASQPKLKDYAALACAA